MKRGVLKPADFPKMLLCISAAFLCSHQLRADDMAVPDYSIVPPSPNVAAFMDLQDYPVDYFRGIPKINFPLYALRIGQIELPITLSYNGGGIRAEQNVGNAGLGWTISCGATIAHTVYGMPDDANRIIHGMNYLDSNEQLFRDKLIEKVWDFDPTDGYEYKTKRYWQATLGSRYYEGKTDVANDLYNLYGLGLSASFTILPNTSLSKREIIMSSENPLKISMGTDGYKGVDSGCDAWGFVVTDQKGLNYKFLTQERTRYDFNYGNPQLERMIDSIYYSSAWHIDEITDPLGNSIKFSYSALPSVVWKDTNHPVARGFSEDYLKKNAPYLLSGLNSVIYHPKELTQIEGNGIIIRFEYSHGTTSQSEALIRKITIESPAGDQKKIELHYSGNLLTSVVDQDEELYKFSYTTVDNSGTYFYWDEQDFGGYCNGKENNTLIPTKSYPAGGSVGYGADRSVNPEYALKGSLKRITYATGGYTEFDWESNNFSYLKDKPFYGSINETQIVNVEVDTLRACMEPGYEKLKLTGWTISTGQLAEVDLTKYFNMNPANLFQSAYHDSHKYDWDPEMYPEKNPPHYPHLVVRESSSRKIMRVIFLDKETIEPNGEKIITSLQLPKGTYDFELINPLDVSGAEEFIEREFLYHDGLCGYLYLRKVTTDASSSVGRENWCGLRIKRIKSYAGEEDNDILRKDYYYNIYGDPSATSGTVQELPQYDYIYYQRFPAEYEGYKCSDVYCVGTTAFPQTTSGTFSTIEYPQVMTCMGMEDRNEPNSYLNSMKESFIFSSSRDSKNCDFLYLKNYAAPYQPVGSRMYTSNAHRRGNLERKIAYKNIGLPSQITEYAYNIYEPETFTTLTTDAYPVCDFTLTPGYNKYGCYEYGIGTFTLIPYNKTLSSEIITDIDGMDSYVKYEYFYNSYTDNLDWNLVKNTSTTDSENRKITTHYTYMRGDGYWLPYPETEVIISGNNVLNASRMEYDPVKKLVVRKYTLSKKSSADELLSENQGTTAIQKQRINTLTYEYRYNDNGNLIQISYKGKPLAAYIWGYNGLYPIIEATDIDYDTLVGTAMSCGLTKNQIEGQEVASSSLVDNVSKRMREALTKSNITSISYHWLLGIVKQTSPRGEATNFAYDNIGRLSEVRDFNNYLISKYEYYYENASIK